MKKGFTLVELLAIIALLAVITTIAVPIVIGLIQSAEERTFRTNVQKIIQSVEVYKSSYEMEYGKELINATIKIVNKRVEGDLFTIGSDGPESGEIFIDENGKISIAFYKKGLCASKVVNNNEITIIQSAIQECKLSE